MAMTSQFLHNISCVLPKVYGQKLFWSHPFSSTMGCLYFVTVLNAFNISAAGIVMSNTNNTSSWILLYCITAQTSYTMPLELAAALLPKHNLSLGGKATYSPFYQLVQLLTSTTPFLDFDNRMLRSQTVTSPLAEIYEAPALAMALLLGGTTESGCMALSLVSMEVAARFHTHFLITLIVAGKRLSLHCPLLRLCTRMFCEVFDRLVRS